MNETTMTRREYDARCAYLKQENAKFGPTMVPIPKHLWPTGFEPLPESVWRNRDFLAQVFPPLNGGQRISILRSAIDRDGNWLEDISWDDLMAVKRGCGFGDRWAVEIYPPDSAVVNVANMRHLWGTEDPAFAWNRPVV